MTDIRSRELLVQRMPCGTALTQCTVGGLPTCSVPGYIRHLIQNLLQYYFGCRRETVALAPMHRSQSLTGKYENVTPCVALF